MYCVVDMYFKKGTAYKGVIMKCLLVPVRKETIRNISILNEVI